MDVQQDATAMLPAGDFDKLDKRKHDDLATALGLSCLEDPFSERVSHSKRVY